MNDSINVAFIVIDTLRKDYAKPMEEVLKKFGFISYENVISPAPWTMPSHASMFTGLYPAFHGAHETKDKKDTQIKLKRKEVLSLKLRDMGFETYLLSANPYIRPTFGFRGFEHFYYSSGPYFPILTHNEKDKIRDIIDRYNVGTKLELIRILTVNKKFKLMIKGSLSYLFNKPYTYLYSLLKKWPKDKGANEIIKTLKKTLPVTVNDPKFIFINLMEVHEPYSLSENCLKIIEENLKANKLDPNLVNRWRVKYSTHVNYVTKKVVEVMNILKQKDMFNNSFIIVTSDHGQLLGEHGRVGHITFLYDELLRVPLLIKYPKNCEIKYPRNKNSRYISLVNLKPFIHSIVDNKLEDDSILYSDVVFAESYGIPLKISKISTKEEKMNIEQLEKYRIAIYYKNFKGIFNVNDWKFENLMSHSSNPEVSEDAINCMKKQVMKFLRTVEVAKIPKIKKLSGGNRWQP